ncbi:hypothetical protein [Moraxella bovis]|uniref:hypothetical protein n=1 Tax=Moraxella bovis TaxID=476 RepID=UPI000993F828|nr:hypothetical protein [Moraxella bovis]OOR90984.1 hypothetical protein B0182_04165 [Moraxella bovis]
MDYHTLKSFILAFLLVFPFFVFHFKKDDLTAEVNCFLLLHETENLTYPDILKIRQEVTENCFK